MTQTAQTLTSILQALGRNLSVLILDDERFDRHRLARLCSGLEMKCDVTNAASLLAFESQLETRRYDVILVDYMLPDGTGMHALEAIRCSALNFGAAAIMITGHAEDAVATEALRLGCVEYLLKETLTAQTFRAALTKALNNAKPDCDSGTQTFARSDVEAVLERFATQFAADIKPVVSRTLRQLRDLRSAPDAEKITAVENSCMTIWETLVALERHTGPEMMAATLTTPPPPVAAQRKPPSPFARIN